MVELREMAERDRDPQLRSAQAALTASETLPSAEERRAEAAARRPSCAALTKGEAGVIRVVQLCDAGCEWAIEQTWVGLGLEFG